MDLEEYWQENKTFVARVGAGLVVFLVGWGVIGATVGARKDSAVAQVSRTRSELRKERYDSADRNQAQEDHDALVANVEDLRSQVDFLPRPEFRDPSRPSDTNRYLDVQSRVRAELLPLASRRNVEVVETLGLPAQSPTRPEEIERYLDALDVTERVVRAAIEERVKRVETIKTSLDPRILGKKSKDVVEKNRVTFTIQGDDVAIERLLVRLQAPEPQPLVVEEAVIKRERNDPDSVELVLEVVVARVPNVAALAEVAR
ncbi:MAG: hypothetical protein R3F34_08005 [Planctomycetota bacterium]